MSSASVQSSRATSTSGKSDWNANDDSEVPLSPSLSLRADRLAAWERRLADSPDAVKACGMQTPCHTPPCDDVSHVPLAPREKDEDRSPSPECAENDVHHVPATPRDTKEETSPSQEEDAQDRQRALEWQVMALRKELEANQESMRKLMKTTCEERRESARSQMLMTAELNVAMQFVKEQEAQISEIRDEVEAAKLEQELAEARAAACIEDCNAANNLLMLATGSTPAAHSCALEAEAHVRGLKKDGCLEPFINVFKSPECAKNPPAVGRRQSLGCPSVVCQPPESICRLSLCSPSVATTVHRVGASQGFQSVRRSLPPTRLHGASPSPATSPQIGFRVQSPVAQRPPPVTSRHGVATLQMML